MPCYFPISAWYGKGVSSKGKRPISFKPVYVDRRKPELELPCGQCIGCKLEYSRQWAMRCVHEASLHMFNCFVTLTYNDENLPENGSLVPRDLQLFWKRLRKHLGGKKIKYFACGEYGEESLRPHYHACVFNYFPNDFYHVKGSGDCSQGISEFLSRVWSKGNVDVGQLTFQSAAYVAAYVTKKLSVKMIDKSDMSEVERERFRERFEQKYSRVDPITGEIKYVEPEFARMSRGGRTGKGIASGWFDKFGIDSYDKDSVIIGERAVSPPKYYDKCFEEINPQKLEGIKAERLKNLRKHKENLTKDRLQVRERVARGKLAFKERNKT